MPATGEHKHRRRRPSPERIDAARKQHMVLLGLLILLVFVSTLGGGFVWSDREDLLQGAYRVDSGSDIGAAMNHSRDGFRALTLGGDVDPSAGSWQPIALLKNTISWTLWGECAFCFHLESILLHLAIVIGLYALGRHLLSHRRHGNRIAAWSAALYAVHPATVSTVSWIGGQTTMLAAGFSVWTLVIFTRLPATTNSRPGHIRRWLIALAVTSLCAYLTHESTFMLPLLALLVSAVESGERGRHPLGGISPRRRKGMLVLMATLLLVVLYRQLAFGGIHFAASYPTDGFFTNLGTALRHLWFLIDESILPVEPVLSDAWPISQSWGAGDSAALLGLLVILAAIAVGFWFHHPAALGASWFLLWILPGVGAFPSSHYHDSHTLYLAIWGLSFALGFVILQLWRPVGRQLIPGSEALAYVPLILILGVITAFSNARWWNHTGLFEAEVASDPHYMEGRVELAKSALENGDPQAAITHLTAAIDASRDSVHTGFWSPRDAYLLLGQGQWRLNRHDQAEKSLAHALEAAPNDADVHYWLGLNALSQQDYLTAEQRLRKALDLRNEFAPAKADLGVALAGQKRFVEALPLLSTAIDGGLGNASRHQALASVYIDGERLQDALRHLEASLALHDNADERARLAWLYWRLGRQQPAVDAFAAAVALSDEDSDYMRWVRAQFATDGHELPARSAAPPAASVQLDSPF